MEESEKEQKTTANQFIHFDKLVKLPDKEVAAQ